MRANQADHPASRSCRALGISESGFYAWRSRPPSRRATDDAALITRIKAIHAMSDGTYGAPRIRAELADVDGRRVNIKRVARLMRQAGVAGVSRRKFCVTTVRDGAPPRRTLVPRAGASSSRLATAARTAWRLHAPGATSDREEIDQLRIEAVTERAALEQWKRFQSDPDGYDPRGEVRPDPIYLDLELAEQYAAPVRAAPHHRRRALERVYARLPPNLLRARLQAKLPDRATWSLIVVQR